MSDALFRIRDLMTLERGGVLDERERSELARLLAALDPSERAALERELEAEFAALDRAFEATAIAASADGEEPLPAELRSRLLAAAEPRRIGTRGGAPTQPRSLAPRSLGWLGWAAAAVLAVATGALLYDRRPAPSGSPTDDLRAAVDAATDVLRLPLASNDPSQAGASGQVVWSASLQKGYLDLRGMTPNDRAAAQFQLWLVDPARDPNPIDGGVFDVPAGSAIVPFAPKLAAVDPQVFAVTSEIPGGVVVTDGPILLVAKRDS